MDSGQSEWVLDMIEIDGSYGEGGGQILRTSISLSALTMQPVRVVNIRSGRSKPGLRRQHLAGIEVTAKLVGARTRGVEVGSTDVEFVPTERRVDSISYDIGTAGSLSLLLQTVIPAAVLSPEPVSLHLRGGTDVSWSPPIDYMREVFAFTLTKLGSSIEIVQKKRGHYPRGGGVVSCMITPVRVLKSLELEDFGELSEIGGVSHCVRLPSHIAERQASSAEKILQNHGIKDLQIRRESYKKGDDHHLGPGSGIVLWAESKEGIRVGADSLGERNKRAEVVGGSAARNLLDELESKMAVDSYLADMLVPFLCIAEGESKIGVSRVTKHLQTNIWASQKMLNVDVSLEGSIGESGKLVVRGKGLSS